MTPVREAIKGLGGAVHDVDPEVNFGIDYFIYITYFLFFFFFVVLNVQFFDSNI